PADDVREELGRGGLERAHREPASDTATQQIEAFVHFVDPCERPAGKADECLPGWCQFGGPWAFGAIEHCNARAPLELSDLLADC
ncbi:MAG: hypothetical protein ACJA14_000201, partial [Ilumatobacter sp.]